MLNLRELAIEFIDRTPDDKIVYIIDVFKCLENFTVEQEKANEQIHTNDKSFMGIGNP